MQNLTPGKAAGCLQDAEGSWVRLDHEISAQLLVAWYCGEQLLDYSFQAWCPLPFCSKLHFFGFEDLRRFLLHPCCNWQGASFQVDLTVWVGQPRWEGPLGCIVACRCLGIVQEPNPLISQ